MAGRPRKPSPTRENEGNRSRTEIPPEVELSGFPECPDYLSNEAAEHFNFIAGEFGAAGVLKRADTPALIKLADLWAKYWKASEAWDNDPTDKEARMGVLGFGAAWDRAAAKLGIQRVDRSRIVTTSTAKPDEQEERFFKVTG